MSVYNFSSFKNSAFSEEIVYTPSGGAAVTIRAVVFRQGAKAINAKSDFSIQHHPIVIEIDREAGPRAIRDALIALGQTGFNNKIETLEAEAATIRAKKAILNA